MHKVLSSAKKTQSILKGRNGDVSTRFVFPSEHTEVYTQAEALTPYIKEKKKKNTLGYGVTLQLGLEWGWGGGEEMRKQTGKRSSSKEWPGGALQIHN